MAHGMRRARARGSWLLASAMFFGCGAGQPPSTSADVTPHARKPERGWVTYLVGGDSRGDDAGVVAWAFDQARSVGAKAFFFLGDMEWSYACDTHFRQEQVERLRPIPFYPVLGNHEIAWFGFLKVKQHVTQAEALFQRRFLGTPDTPVRSRFRDKVTYAVDLEKGLHFVALDNVSERGFGKEQLDWLERDLKEARADPRTRHIVVGMHKPLAHTCAGAHSMLEGGAEGERDSERALSLFVEHGVSMMLASHLHQFAQFEHRGIPTYLSGGLGAHLHPCECADCVPMHHLLQLDVSETEIRVRVVKFPGRQIAADTFEEDDNGNFWPDLRCAG